MGIEEMGMDKKIEYINRVLDEKGEEWVVAAMVDGSIGYHTPSHARKLIERFREGNREDYCERCIALFNCNLVEMLYHDIKMFERLEERDPERVERLLDFVRKVEKFDEVEQLEISLVYPTMSI